MDVDYEKAFENAFDSYRAVFDDIFPTEEVPQMTFKEMTEIMLRCIEEGKPFDPEIPDDCIA